MPCTGPLRGGTDLVGLLPRHPRARPVAPGARLGQGIPGPGAAVRVLGCLCGMRRDPYLKLLTQLFGDRIVVANATGCSSIYGGNLPTTPWGTNRDGRGPAWSNSLFEDNAEFGLGLRLATERLADQAQRLCREPRRRDRGRPRRCAAGADQGDERGITAQRARVELRERLEYRPAERRAPPASPTSWCARASGSWAATDGRTTSAPEASTTSSPPAGT